VEALDAAGGGVKRLSGVDRERGYLMALHTPMSSSALHTWDGGSEPGGLSSVCSRVRSGRPHEF
jgi:hypothetical protein